MSAMTHRLRVLALLLVLLEERPRVRVAAQFHGRGLIGLAEPIIVVAVILIAAALPLLRVQNGLRAPVALLPRIALPRLGR